MNYAPLEKPRIRKGVHRYDWARQEWFCIRPFQALLGIYQPAPRELRRITLRFSK